MEMKDRIRQIMETKQMSQQDFAQELGISPASLSSIFTGRTNPTHNHTQAIHRVFPEISINWLMFGEGDMYVTSTSETMQDEKKEPLDGETLLPFSTGGNELFSAPGRTSEARPAAAYGGRILSTRMDPEPVRTEYIRRNIVEIRVFFDDGTYESFVPGK